MTVYRSCENHNWDSVTLLQYKEDGTLFKDITRRIF
jgi:hypothetical protein